MINASLSILIIDNKSTVGGVWAKEQLYPGLHANNLQGYYEFSDFPMLGANLKHLDVQERGKLTGETVFHYIFEYARHFDLLRRTRFNTKVVCATENESSSGKVWTIKLCDTSDGYESLMTCSKLIVATGQASKPWLPSFPVKDSWKIPTFHSARLNEASQKLIGTNMVGHITIIGGSKSAHDAVYMFATAGKRVTWLTRRSGRGTMPMANSYSQMGPWKVWLEGLLMTRPLSWFGACPWSEGDGFVWIRSLLHGTVIGRHIVRGYFEGMSASTIDQSGILKNTKTKALVPDQNLMWYGTQAGILTYDTDMYKLLRRDNVELIREDIECLEKDSIILQNGQKIKTDALIYATGYDYGPSFTLEPSNERLGWGVPVPVSQDSLFPSLDSRADAELFERFPFLETSPKTNPCQPSLTPWRLWRFIAPPSQVCSKSRSLAFLSTITSYQTLTKCELTSLWTYAYLYDELSVRPNSEEDVTYEAAMWSRFGKWRCPMGMQGKMADFLHDAMPYYDLLLRDLGLRSWRKGWGVFGEIFGRWYEVKDYKGIVEEWIASRKERSAQ